MSSFGDTEMKHEGTTGKSGGSATGKARVISVKGRREEGHRRADSRRPARLHLVRWAGCRYLSPQAEYSSAATLTSRERRQKSTLTGRTIICQILRIHFGLEKRLRPPAALRPFTAWIAWSSPATARFLVSRFRSRFCWKRCCETATALW